MKSLVERAIALSTGATIHAEDLQAQDALGWAPQLRNAGGSAMALFDFSVPMPLRDAKRRMERVYLEQQVQQAGSVVAAAQRLGILANNLSRRLAELTDRYTV